MIEAVTALAAAAVSKPVEPNIGITLIQAGIAAAIAGIVSFVVSERRVIREFRLHFQAEAVLRRLLNHRQWRLRTFDTIKYHVAGFEDDELRKLLVQSGAVRFTDRNGKEIWGLIERNGDLLDRELGTSDN